MYNDQGKQCFKLDALVLSQKDKKKITKNNPLFQVGRNGQNTFPECWK